jgi:Raf kinase inhibitor-like YbhB/YbcL family protein
VRAPLTFELFPPVPEFVVTSEDVVDGERLSDQQVANIMGYNGQNLSPQLSWSGYPATTKSFAITIHDPDAPTGSGFWHWLIFDIPASVSSIGPGAGSSDGSHLVAGAVQVRNDTGQLGYIGAAPPAGDPPHRYVHTVHAVDVETLGLSSDATPAFVGFNLRFHAIARAQLVPIFGS